MFALIYRVNGVDIGGHPDSKHGDGDDYENLLPFLSFFMYAYRTSIGDLEAPNAGNWMNLVDSPNYMVYFIWTIWMLHQWFMNIVFLNFLIAIVSQVYEDDMSATLQNEYRQRIEMNLETENILYYLGVIERL